jgi:stage II sporulation protein D
MKKIYLILLSLAALSLIFFTSCTPSEKYLRTKIRSTGLDNNYVRVLIKKESGSFKISSSSGIKVVDKKTGKIVYESQKGNLTFYPEKIKTVYVIETGINPVYVNESGYRGRIEIHNLLGKIYIINIVNIEEYLASVVPSEMPSSWNMEALKAQAIAARTYTYYHLTQKNDTKNIYDLDSTTNFQVYKGIIAEKDSSTKAVRDTAGLIMTYNYTPILAYFHSTSGGKTADDKYVWQGEDLPYLSSVQCTYSKESPHYEWTTEISLQEIENTLMKKYQRLGKIRSISFKKFDDRVVEVAIIHSNGNLVLTGNQFRHLLDPSKLKSTFFTAKLNKKSFHIYGKGWGHGVGMCQWGAKGRGEKGFNYEQILTYYYQGVKLTKINNNYLAQKRSSGNLVN